MNVPAIASRASKLAADNAPAILTAVGVIGTVTTAVLTHKAAFKAHEILLLEDAKKRGREIEEPPLSNTEIVKLVWKEYIPPVACVALTVTAILSANRISTSRAAALAAAYKLSEKQITEYKDKVVEKFTPQKEKAMREELAQEKVTRTPPTGQQIIVSGIESLCLEPLTGRYFKSDYESLRKASNDINRQILDNNYATIGEFYGMLGLEPTKLCNEIGWSIEHPMDLEISTTLADNGQPVLVVDYKTMPLPIREYTFRDYVYEK